MFDACNACRNASCNAMQEGNCVTVVISSREFARPRDHDYNLEIETRSCRDGNHFKIAINNIGSSRRYKRVKKRALLCLESER